MSSSEVAHARKCPHCGSESTHRSRKRNTQERFLSRVVPVRFYRCDDCRKRFRVLNLTRKSAVEWVFSFLFVSGGVALVYVFVRFLWWLMIGFVLNPAGAPE